MKKITASLILMLMTTTVNAAEYVKPDAGLSLTPQGENMAFSINSSYGDASGSVIWKVLHSHSPPGKGRNTAGAGRTATVSALPLSVKTKMVKYMSRQKDAMATVA